MWARKFLRAIGSSSWTLGDILAAVVVIFGGAVVILSILIQAGDLELKYIGWIWSGMGGNSADTTQISMARAAWVGVIVGVVTIILLGVTLAYNSVATRISLLSVQQAQDLGRAQMRAYVNAHDLLFEFPGDRDFSVPPKISITISNTGQTPARRLRMKMGWHNFNAEELMRVDHSADHSVQELGANHFIVERIPCWDFKHDVMLGHLVGDAVSFVQGVIEYADVFGEEHQTWFRAKISGSYREAVPKLFSQQTRDGNQST